MGAEKKASHQGFILFIIVDTVIIFFLVATVAVYASGLVENEPTVFKSTVRQVLEDNPVDVIPDDWTWIIWCVVFFYLLLWMLYSLMLLCTKTHDKKGYLYLRPHFVPMITYALFGLSLLVFAGWLYIWTAEWLRWAALALGGTALLGILSFITAVRGLHMYKDDLIRQGDAQEIVKDRLFVQNSLGMYMAWMTFAAIINLAVALVYEWDMDQVDASTTALASMGGLIIIYFILDILVFEKAMRYVLMPYVIFSIVLAAILVKEFDGGDRNFMVSLFLVGLAGFTTLFKVASMISNARRSHDECTDELRQRLLESDDEDAHVNDEETAKYIKKAQLLLSSK